MHVAETQGIDIATLMLREQPDRLADLRNPDPYIGETVRRHLNVAREYARDAAVAAAIEGKLAYEAQEAARDTAEAIQARRLDTVFRRAVATLYEDPVGVRGRFMDHAADHGIHSAAERLKTSPESFGTLRSPLGKNTADAQFVDAMTRTSAHLAADAGKGWAEYELRVGSGTAYVPALQDAYDRAERTQLRFERTLAEVYREPGQVRQVFFSIADDEGLYRASEELRSGPYRFGLTHSIRIDSKLGTQHVPITIDPAWLEILVARGRADYRVQQDLGIAKWVDERRGVGHAFRAALHDAYQRVSEAW